MERRKIERERERERKRKRKRTGRERKTDALARLQPS